MPQPALQADRKQRVLVLITMHFLFFTEGILYSELLWGELPIILGVATVVWDWLKYIFLNIGFSVNIVLPDIDRACFLVPLKKGGGPQTLWSGRSFPFGPNVPNCSSSALLRSEGIVSLSVGWEPSELLPWVLNNPIWVPLQSCYAQASAELSTLSPLSMCLNCQDWVLWYWSGVRVTSPAIYQSRDVMQPMSGSVTASAMISWCHEAWNSICFLCYRYRMVCPSCCSSGMINNCIS